MLNPASPLPLYHQLAELLGERISRGELLAGARLPSEPALAREHRIGRPTVRQATELLVQRGLIERRRGSGTYVRPPRPRVDLFSLVGTLSSFSQGGVELETELVQRAGLRQVTEDADNPFSGRQAYTLRRVSRCQGVPVLLEQLYLEPALFPGLLELELEGVSLSRLVAERYYLRPTHAEQSFRVGYAPAALRPALAASPRQPLLIVKRTLFFPRAPRAIFAELFCRTDSLSFSQTISEQGHHG